jgi:TRAP-type C4-dicarboxylate transport system permease small subunit
MEILLGLMILLVVVDVTLRRLFDHPLSFSYELMGFGLVIVVWSSILYSTMRDRHISVDIITSHFPVKARRVLNAVADFISMILLFAIGWRSIIYGFQLRESGQISVMLDLPFYPFIFLIAFGAICAGFMLLVSFIESIKPVKSAVKK